MFLFNGIIKIQLQLILIIGCIFTYWYIIRKVKKSNVRIDDIIIWIIGIVTFLVCSIFPQIPTFISDLLGFESPANSIFCLVIFFLFIMVFLLTIRVSQLQEKIKELTHTLALVDKQSSNTDEK